MFEEERDLPKVVEAWVLDASASDDKKWTFLPVLIRDKMAIGFKEKSLIVKAGDVPEDFEVAAIVHDGGPSALEDWKKKYYKQVWHLDVKGPIQ